MFLGGHITVSISSETDSSMACNVRQFDSSGIAHRIGFEEHIS